MEPIVYGLVAGAVVLIFGLWFRSRQAKNPHGKCVYCGRVLGKFGPYKTKCPSCKRLQPWAETKA